MKNPTMVVGLVLRVLSGTAGSLLAGILVARALSMLPPIQVVTTGALAAGVLSLVRVSRPAESLALVIGFGLWQLGQSWRSGMPEILTETAWALVVGGGAFIAAVVFDRLGEAGFRIGKFLIVGPLLGGIFVAATPLALIGAGAEFPVAQHIWLNALLGIVIGDGVGLGVEIVELFPGVVASPPASTASRS